MKIRHNSLKLLVDVWICSPNTSFIVCFFYSCKFYFCSFDLCGQSEPRENDKSDQTSMSQRLRDNPAVCHLNSFRRGEGVRKESEEADRTMRWGQKVERGVWCWYETVITVLITDKDRLVCFWIGMVVCEKYQFRHNTLPHSALRAWAWALSNMMQLNTAGTSGTWMLLRELKRNPNPGETNVPDTVRRSSVDKPFKALNGNHNKRLSLLQ